VVRAIPSREVFEDLRILRLFARDVRRGLLKKPSGILSGGFLCLGFGLEPFADEGGPRVGLEAFKAREGGGVPDE